MTNDEQSIPDEIINGCRKLENSWSPRFGGLDRERVIVAVAELEGMALQALIRFTCSQRGDLSGDEAAKALNEVGINHRTSLERLAQMLFVVGRIDDELLGDFRVLYKIRVKYAHQAKRKQLDEEPELEALIRQMDCFRRNCDRLESLPSIRNIYRAIERHLRTRLASLP